jgi:cell division topological specificity factor
MSLFGFLRRGPTPAQQARARLKAILVQDRQGGSLVPDFVPRLQEELLAVIGRYIRVDRNSVTMEVHVAGEVSRLEVDVLLSEGRVVRP